MEPIPPLRQRLLNVLAYGLDVSAVGIILWSAGLLIALLMDGHDMAWIAPIASAILLVVGLLLVATLNYLLFGFFRLWNRFTWGGKVAT